jgi:cytochrome c biogenesis protein CcmG/thiol:disulfide interchange protein DsbE
MNQQATQPPESGTGSSGSRWRLALPLGLFAALLIVLFFGLVHSPEKGVIISPLVGKAAPQFSIPNLVSGAQPVSNASLRGHWSVVNVWGSWCVTCRDEHSTLLMIKQQGVVPIIGIDWNDTPANANTWLQQLGDPYDQIGEDPDGHVAIDWGVSAAPESFLVNPQGIIVYKQVGEITPDVWREQFLARIDAAGGAGPAPATGGTG